jgi:hypothetical protein
VLREQRNVFAPLTERRQRHRDDVQAVKEVLAERPLLDHLAQVHVARGDDADVESHRARFADTLDLALLQRAQQLGLQRQRHRRQLVDEERAAMGELESAGARRDRTGERTLDVTEQLRLGEILRNRRRR